MPVSGLDGVVGRAEVGRGHDEVHVEVGIVVLQKHKSYWQFNPVEPTAWYV